MFRLWLQVLPKLLEPPHERRQDRLAKPNNKRSATNTERMISTVLLLFDVLLSCLIVFI